MPMVIPAVVAVVGTVASSIGAAAAAAGIATGIAGFLGSSALFGLTTVGGLIGFAATAASAILGVVLAPSGQRSGLGGGLGIVEGSQRRQAIIAEPARFRFLGAGVANAGGALIFHDTTKPDGRGDLVRMVVIDCEEIEGVSRIQVNGQTVTVDAEGWVQQAPWAGKMQIVVQSGAADQGASPLMREAFPDLWTEAHRCRGLATAFIRQKTVSASRAAETYPNGARGEVVTFTARRSRRVYDPRTGETGFSDNAALVALWYAMHADGLNIPLADIDADAWAAAAEECDVLVENAAGVLSAQYRAGGFVTLDLNKIDVFRALLDNFDAAPFLNYADGSGRLGVRISNPDLDPETGVIEKHHVLAISDTGEPGVIEDTQAVRTVFTDPDRGYNEATTPPYPAIPAPGAALRAAAALGDSVIRLSHPGAAGSWFVGRRFYLRGGLYRVAAVAISGDDVDLTITPPAREAIEAGAGLDVPTEIVERERPFCPSWSQAQRLDKKDFLKLVAPQKVEVRCTLAREAIRATDRVRLDFVEAMAVGDFRCEAWSMARDGLSVDLMLSAIDPDFDDWDPVREEAINALPLVSAADVSAVGAPGLIGFGAIDGAGLGRLAWSNRPVEAPVLEITWREAGAPEFDRGPISASVEPGAAVLDFSEAAGLIDIRARFLTSGGAVSQFEELLGVNPFASPVTPAAPAIAAGAAQVEEGAAALITVTPAEAGSWRVELLEAETNDFAAAVKIGDVISGGAAEFSVTRASLGVRFYWGRVVGLSGATGPESAALSIETIAAA